MRTNKQTYAAKRFTPATSVDATTSNNDIKCSAFDIFILAQLAMILADYYATGSAMHSDLPFIGTAARDHHIMTIDAIVFNG